MLILIEIVPSVLHVYELCQTDTPHKVNLIKKIGIGNLDSFVSFKWMYYNISNHKCMIGNT